jgi:hypothetical protein
MSSGTAPTPYVLGNQQQSASQAQGAATELGNLGAATTGAAVPGYQSLYNSAQTNPYYGNYQAGVGSTGANQVSFGQGEVSQGAGLQALGNQYASYIPGTLATAYDPQNALYNQTQQANTQQQSAINAANGVAGSPFGAGLTAQNNQNFNINWQNNQQQRQIAGLNAAQGLGQTDASLQTTGGDLGAAGYNSQYQGYQAPYQAYNQNQSVISQALNQLVQGDSAAGQPYSAQSQSNLGYLGAALGSEQANLQSFQAQQQADNSFWSGLGSILGGVGGLAGGALGFGGLSGLFGGGGFSAIDAGDGADVS